MKRRRHCCFPDCPKQALYIIVDGPAVDAYTESCAEHVPDLGGHENAVYSVTEWTEP